MIFSPILNQQTENAIGEDFTTLKVYKKLQILRQKESFQWGKMTVSRDGDLLMYTRKAQGFPGYLVAINFGSIKHTKSFSKATGYSKKIKLIFHSHKKENIIDINMNDYTLDSGHAIVLEFV